MQIHEFRRALDSSENLQPTVTAVRHLQYRLPSEIRRDIEESQLALWAVWYPGDNPDDPPEPPLPPN